MNPKSNKSVKNVASVQDHIISIDGEDEDEDGEHDEAERMSAYLPISTELKDRYMLEFNFIESKVYLYQNENKLEHVTKLESECIIPLLALLLLLGFI